MILVRFRIIRLFVLNVNLKDFIFEVKIVISVTLNVSLVRINQVSAANVNRDMDWTLLLINVFRLQLKIVC